MCISLAAHHNFIRGWPVGYLANWQNPFCHILLQQQHFTYTINSKKWHWILNFLVRFY